MEQNNYNKVLFYGAVYIFENIEARRVKVGITINPNQVKRNEGRLKDANDIWFERVGKCQICGTRLEINSQGLLSEHLISGRKCIASNCPPLELSTSVAESYLLELREQHESLSGSEKGSCTKKIKTLERRIEQYSNKARKVGRWELRVLYYQSSPAALEKEAHKILDEYLDHNAPMGEIFSCSVSKAKEAIESVLTDWDILSSTETEVFE